MSKRVSSPASFVVALLAAGVVVSPAAIAASPARELAVSRTLDDPQLKWDACPPLFPKGCEIAVLHGDPAKDHADVFFRVPANYTIPSHWHTSPEHMVLVSGELHVTYDSQETAILKPGTYAYGPAKAPHKAVCKSAGACVLFIAFETPIDAQPADQSSK